MSDLTPGPSGIPPASTAGAADHMVYVFDSQTQGPILAAVVPIRTSSQATEPGRLLVANGLEFTDFPAAPIFTGDGAPGGDDGTEGAFWLDQTSGLLHGPKGFEAAGQWPQTPRQGIPVENSRYKLDRDLLLGTHSIDAIRGVHALRMTNFGSGELSANPNYVGLELIVGSDVSAPSGLGWVGLRPQGSHPNSVKHLRLGGHAGGAVQDLAGRNFLVQEDLPVEHVSAAPAGLLLDAGTPSGTIPLSDVQTHGAWTNGAQGFAAPRQGTYRLVISAACKALTEPAHVRIQFMIDGATPSVARVAEAWPTLAQPSNLVLESRLQLNAGEAIRVQSDVLFGQVEWLAGIGHILFERVA